MPDNAERLLKLADLAFPDLTPGEREVLRCAATGEWADLARWEVPPQPEGKKRKPGGGPLRSAVLQWLCADDAQAMELVHRKGVCIRNATLDQPLDLERAEVPFFFGLHSCRLPHLNAQRAKFSDTLYLKHCGIDGMLDLGGTHIGGQFLCDGAQIIGTDGVTIRADGADIGNGVFLSDGFRAMGEVRLLGAKIKGQLSCKGGRFLHRKGTALNATSADIGNDVFLSDGFWAVGEVRLLGAKIKGQFNCKSGHFLNRQGKALSADRADIGSSMLLSDGFRAVGEVRLLGAKITGQLDCSGGRFQNRNGDALTLESASIGDTLFLEPKPIQGKLVLFNAKIATCLRMTSKSTAASTLDLRGAKIGELFDTPQSWPEAGKLLLDGFQYDDIDQESPRRATERLEWLGRIPKGQFLPQPYEQLAQWFQKTGHDSEARDIRVAKEKARMKQWLTIWSLAYWRALCDKWCGRTDDFEKDGEKTPNPAAKPWKLFLKEPFKRLWWRIKWLTIGYGYRPQRAIYGLGILIVLGCVLFTVGQKGMTESISYNLKAIDGSNATATLVASDYPKFRPFVYSMDVALPIVDLQQERYWMPNYHHHGPDVPWWEEGWWLWGVNWLEILAGWALATMGIAGATGIIKKD